MYNISNYYQFINNINMAILVVIITNLVIHGIIILESYYINTKTNSVSFESRNFSKKWE